MTDPITIKPCRACAKRCAELAQAAAHIIALRAELEKAKAELEAFKAVSVAVTSDRDALVAETAAMRAVVDAAVEWDESRSWANDKALSDAVDAYLKSKETDHD